MRATGVLLPIASLPTKYGIGGFSKEAYDFVDWLKAAGVDYWQILPLGPTGYGDSPYQSISTFAGNPYFIDLETLTEEGLLTEEECKAADCGKDPKYIDYGAIYNTRLPLLKKAYKRSKHKKLKKYQEFCEKNAYWLEDYALFVSIKNSKNGECWISWDKDIRTRTPEALKKYKEKFAEEIDFYKFNQFKFMEQWTKLKKYANDNGIKIIGDIPIYVALDSSDAWGNTNLFEFDKNCKPKSVAGCPPDAFAATGQLWGNPLYNWKVHKESGFSWWLSRISHCYELYDVIRVDHFRGFDEYYSIPAKDKTAENGKWKKGPGIELFNTIKKKLGEKDIIAEDLGFLTPSVMKLLKDSGFPGMKVLQFAFDPHTPSIYLPHKHIENSVVYTGTHDNDTTRGWFKSLGQEDKKYIGEYLGCGEIKEEEISWIFIRAALRSVSKLAVIPMQDILDLGSEARLNAPSTFGENWKWRLQKGQASPKIAEKLARCNWMYERHIY
ncbi:MAG: 4-alpha-glucanotransferase [Lachnospiraceae bacterium]|nr:4-alpha-glucanotransferase [Lachnospiraceae bacterium]